MARPTCSLRRSCGVVNFDSTVGVFASGSHFKDEHQRTLILRGVNLGGSSKVPARPETSHELPHFYQHRDVSFVGRPFPLPEADEHFRRLRRWGLTLLRLVVPWEAIEHAGPGLYDEEYLQYLHQLVERAHRYGLQVVIDPHQDAWSRLSGGDGAPGWTFETAGLEVAHFHACAAALIHVFQRRPLAMHWPVNYQRLAAMTMFTLFWAGSHFASALTVAGESIQTFLQRHYVGAFQRIARTLKDLPNVLGFGTMNEPSAGFIGLPNLATYP